MIPTTLTGFFQVQDEHVQANCEAMSEEFSLLEEALPLAMETAEYFKTKPIGSGGCKKSSQMLQVESARLNLADATCFTAVSVCRLLSFGAFANMFSLYRDALELYACYWYLGYCPSAINIWNNLRGTKKTIVEYGKNDFERFRRKAVRQFQHRAATAIFHKDLNDLFSTLGTHPNPLSLSMYLPVEGRELNRGYCSAGEDENLRWCAHYLLHLLMSLLKDLHVTFLDRKPTSGSGLREFPPLVRRGRSIVQYVPSHYFLPYQSLVDRLSALEKSFKSYDAAFKGEFSFW